MIEYAVLRQPVGDLAAEDEYERVDMLARSLMTHLNAQSELLDTLNRHGAASKSIQERVGRLLEGELGFRSEVVVSADEGILTRARADFYFALDDTSGVIAEVERGGTTANNHDLKDLWKAHLATNAQHLFLIVPRELVNEAGHVREKPFPKVVRRMRAFFVDERRFVDVKSVHVFGY